MKTWMSSQLSSSLFILILSVLTLSYMVYRTDVNEYNSTLRDSGFMILQRLNHLQRLSDEVRYGSSQRDVTIEGWSDVLLIEDLTIFFPKDIRSGSSRLHKTWQKEFERLEDDGANKRVTKAIKAMRTEIKESLKQL